MNNHELIIKMKPLRPHNHFELKTAWSNATPGPSTSSNPSCALTLSRPVRMASSKIPVRPTLPAYCDFQGTRIHGAHSYQIAKNTPCDKRNFRQPYVTDRILTYV